MIITNMFFVLGIKSSLCLGSLALLSLPLIGCSSLKEDVGTPALFDTKNQAEKAAKDFGCSGAHKMGNKWMPCDKHSDIESIKTRGHEAHSHNH